MSGTANRILLGCALACAAGALVIALGASTLFGAVLTAAIVAFTIATAARPARTTPETWQPVRVVTRAALLAVAVTAGASLVAYGMNQGTTPATSNTGPDEQRLPADGATFAPIRDARSPETPASEVEESLTESPSESPTDAPSEEPTDRPTREPKPTPSAEPSPTPTPTPSPSPSPTPSPSETPTGDGCLLGLFCPKG